ncbi:PREDICTED: cation/H(+) antiporter 15-like [Fragaria vesca subsp. vesca]
MTSRFLYYFFKPLGQTKFVCYLLGGIILGPSLMGHSKEIRDNLYGKKIHLQLFDTIAEIGSIYAIFLMSLKFDFAVLRRNAKKSWKIGIGGFLFPTVVTFSLIYPITGTAPKVPWLMSTVTLSFSYFPVISQALYELNLMSSELGQLAMSSAMLNDALEWTSLTVGLIAAQNDCFKGILTFLSILGMLLFTLYVIRPLMIMIIKNTPEGKEVNEIYTVGILLGVLVMSVISDSIGLLSVGGPIFMGLVIPDGPPLGAAIEQKTEFVVSEFLMPMYFFRVGVSIDVHAIGDPATMEHLQSIILVLFVSKIVGVTLSGLLCKIGFKNSFMLSMIMSMKGLIELNALRHWRGSQIIDGAFYNQMVLSSLVLTMIVTPIVRFSYIPHMRLKEATKDLRVRNIQSTPKDDEACRILFCVHNEENAGNIITFLEASNPTDASPICASVVHTVDLVGHSVPQLTPYRNRNKFRQIDRPLTNQMMQAFDTYSKNSRGPVVIEAYSMVAPYTSMHENIFRLALENLVPLIIVPFHENHQSVVGPSMTGPIRQFNLNVQEFSPCTVGILVDRGLCCPLKKSSFYSNVALFFIGGPDDREALAYASRMTDNPDVCLTVFRIIMRINKIKSNEEDLTEFKLDKSLINEFKLRNTGNDRLNWHDTEVGNCVEVMDVIKNSQSEYDLVMVGRRHPYMSLREEEMTDFIQNPELGMIGDVLASPDFCNGMVKVLVMQESRQLSYGAYHNESITCTGISCTR